MATTTHSAPDEAHAGEHHEHPNYVRVYVVLLVLLAVSVIGPELGIRWVTLVTAFGVALWKAYLVAKNFMHINIAPRYVGYLMTTALVFLLLFFAGTAPDVMKEEGARWEKPSWKQPHPGPGAGGHGEAHH